MHDRYGIPIEVGDQVMIPATIVGIQESHTVNKYCNIQVQLDVKMGLDEEKAYYMTMALNAGQVEKVEETYP